MEKVLSIKQPWSSLIIEDIKPIENRTWRTNYRGKLLIHASAVYDKSSNGSLSNLLGLDRWSLLSQEFIDRYKDLPTSAIIGEATLLDCVNGYDNIWADKRSDEQEFWFKSSGKKVPTIWHWVLESPIKYENPILNVRGKLSIWDY